MTEKELRKLSRIELLELLLSQIKENEILRQELEKKNNQPGNGLLPEDALAEIARATQQLNSALCFADRVTRQLQNMSVNDNGEASVSDGTGQDYAKVPSDGTIGENTTNRLVSDRGLYWRIMKCYSNSTELMSGLPVEIQRDIIHRLRDIKNAKQY